MIASVAFAAGASFVFDKLLNYVIQEILPRFVNEDSRNTLQLKTYVSKKDKILQSKLGLLNLAREIGNISKACELMGYSRDSYYRLKKLYDKGGASALQEKTRKQPNFKNRVRKTTAAAVVEMALQDPELSQSKVADDLTQQGISISPAGVRSIWKRYDLENFEKRAKAVVAQILQGSCTPNEQQLAALKKAQTKLKRLEKRAIFYPGHIVIHAVEALAKHKELGTLYQFVMLDTYSHMAFVYISNNTSTNSAVDALKSQLLALFEKEELPILNIYTSNNPAFTDQSTDHNYQRFANQKGISVFISTHENPWQKKLDSFLKLLNNKFYAEALRRNYYQNIETLQIDLNEWVSNYNNQQPISKSYNYGKTPKATFDATIPIAKYLKTRNRDYLPKEIQPHLELLKHWLV